MILLVSNTVFKISTGHLKRASFFLIFVTRENNFFLSESRDPLLFRFVNRARDPSCTTLIFNISSEKLHENQIMVSFDVEWLLTTVPVKETVQVLLIKLESNHEIKPF